MALALRGLCHHQRGSSKQAAKDCRDALRLDPNNEVAIELEKVLKH